MRTPTHATTRPVLGRVSGLLMAALALATVCLGTLTLVEPAAAEAAPASATPMATARAEAAGLSSVAPAPASLAHLGGNITTAAPATAKAGVQNGLKTGCGVLSAVCDKAGDVAGDVKDKAGDVKGCVTSPVECAKDAGEDVKEGVEEKVKGVKDCVDNPTILGCLKGVGGAVPHPGVPGITGSSCGILDALCDKAPKLPGLGGIPGLGGVPGLGGIPGLGTSIPGLGGIPDPLSGLGDIIAKAAADAWTAAMLAIWSAGLFVLRIVLTFSEMFLTPDLSADGPGKDVYAYTLWGALVLVLIMTLVQLGVAAFKREGKSLARAVIGAGQFVVVCSCWFGGCALVVAACGAITKALMKALLGVNTWPDWDPLGGLSVQSIADGTVATVLGLLGLVLWLAALGHLLVYLARAASLLVLAASGPLSAAGLVSDAGRSWFWKSLRWFLAAAFTPVIMVLVLGIGVQMANGVAAHLADDTQKTIGTALPAVMLICVSAVAPLALFKLLAFVDPGTPSGASFRQGLAAQGGIQTLLSGNLGSGGGGGSTSASKADSNGRSAGEQGSESDTSGRFSGAINSLVGKAGPVGGWAASGMGMVQSIGAKGTSLMADETNQSGVGHQTYGPDFSKASSKDPYDAGRGTGGHPSKGSDSNDDGGGDDPTPTPTPPTPPTPSTLAPPVNPPSPPSGGQGQGGQSPGGGKPPAGAPSGGGGGVPADVPPVPPV